MDEPEELAPGPMANLAAGSLKGYVHGEIIGLKGTTNGRSCELHACCGRQVELNDTVMFCNTIATIQGVDQLALKAVLIKDGIASCCVGFLPQAVVTRSEGILHQQLAQVTELYALSDNSTKLAKDHQLVGVARYTLLVNEVNAAV
jgi:hypothetical protein